MFTLLLTICLWFPTAEKVGPVDYTECLLAGDDADICCFRQINDFDNDGDVDLLDFAHLQSDAHEYTYFPQQFRGPDIRIRDQLEGRKFSICPMSSSLPPPEEMEESCITLDFRSIGDKE